MNTATKIVRDLLTITVAGSITYVVVKAATDYAKAKEKEIVRAEIRKSILESITPNL